MNNSNVALKRYAYELSIRSNGLVFAESFVSGCVFLVTLTGNFLVLWFVYRNPSLRTIPTLFIVSLAVSDILMAVSNSVLCLSVLIQGSWHFADITCQFQGFGVAVLACVSLQTLTLTAVNRYYIIIKPNQYRAIFNRRNTKMMIIGVWILACTEPLLYLISGNRYVFHPGKYFCFQDMKIDFVTILIYIYVAVPMTVLTPCYFKVFKAIRAHKKRMNSIQAETTASSRITVADIKVTNTLFLTVCAFLICWVPISLVDVIDFASGEWTLPRQVYYMYSMFGQASTAINPFIYGMMNKTFREEYIKLFRVLKRPFERLSSNKRDTNAIHPNTSLEVVPKQEGNPLP